MFNFESLLNDFRKIENCKVLNEKETKDLDYPFYPKGIVWEVDSEITFKGDYKSLVFYICFPDTFPYRLPKIFIKKEIYEELKYIPHINKDCSICIFDDGLNYFMPKENIGTLVEYIVHQGKSIISLSENENYKNEEFKREFKAYWEIEYGGNDKTLNIGLHLLDSFKSDLIKGIRFKNKLSNYEYALYNEGTSWNKFKNYLKDYGFQYEEINVVVIDNVFTSPPYDLTFKRSLEILKRDQLSLLKFKNDLKKSTLDCSLIIFPNFINGKTEIYGWIYRKLIVPLSTLKGTQRRIKGLEILAHSIFGKSNATRLTFDNFTMERIQLRTSGIIEEYKSLSLSGLGSIGSNLIFFLMNLPIVKFHLIDGDLLKIENINRHLCGFNDVNKSKVTAIKNHIITSNPLCEVEVKEASVLTVINENANFINDCDFHIVSIGNSMIEDFILNSIVNKTLTKPTFIFWVEPFLASGQMLFINPKDANKAISLINNFRYNVLANEDNLNDKTYLKEGSCQSGYFPYSSTSLIQFLSAVFPYIKAHITDDNLTSTVYTWIGNKEFLKLKDLVLTDFSSEKYSYELIINYL